MYQSKTQSNQPQQPQAPQFGGFGSFDSEKFAQINMVATAISTIWYLRAQSRIASDISRTSFSVALKQQMLDLFLYACQINERVPTEKEVSLVEGCDSENYVQAYSLLLKELYAAELLAHVKRRSFYDLLLGQQDKEAMGGGAND